MLQQSTVLLVLVLCLFVPSPFSSIQAFAFGPCTNIHRPFIQCRVVARLTNTEHVALSDLPIDDHNDKEEEGISFLFEEPQDILDSTEKAWRYAKKPLLRIGSKGATHAHGNSLRQLLEDHTVVRVKVNTKKFNNSVQQASEMLKALAIENGGPADLELIQIREGSKEIMFGMPGTLQKMEEGTFPPAPIEDEVDEEDEISNGTAA